MKINNHRNRGKITLVIVAIVLVAIAAYLAFAYKTHNWPFKAVETTSSPQPTINYKEPTKSESQTGNSIKEKIADAAKSDTSSTTSTPADSSVGVQITTAQKTDGVIYIRALISDITSSGTCRLTISKDGSSPYTAESNTQPLASSSTCKGFNIPGDALSTGTWSVRVDYQNGDRSGSATKEVTV